MKKLRLFLCLFTGLAAQADAQKAQRIAGDTAGATAFNQSPAKLQEVTVSAAGSRMRSHVESTQMGKVDLPVALLLKAPAIGGEPDIIKALQLTPGVKRGTEGGIGMYVRGGGKDENLILLDGATVYNAGHLLGFFSVFNAASLKEAQLYKSSFPAQYGGRLSSVLDVRTKDGSMKDYKASASIGLISSAASVQGPIIKDRLSGIFSIRRTYIDKVFRFIPYYFYDANAKLTYVAGTHDKIFLSGFNGEDILRTTAHGEDSAGAAEELRSGMKLGNRTGSLRWNHTSAVSSLVSDVSIVYTRFRYDITGSTGGNALSMRSAIRDWGARGDFRWRAGRDHKLSAGFSITNHFFNPNIVQSSGAALDQFASREGRQIYNNEGGIYVADDYRLNGQWQLSAGLRISGAHAGERMYAHAEPRLAARYLIDERNAVKTSYARMVQYMHLVSSSSISLPTDLWYPVTAGVRPGISDQVSAGYYHTMPSMGITLSAEAYYKQLQHLVEYREGALLVLNDDYEQDLVRGKGHSYGLELFAGKTSGRFTGWAGYALSYAHRRFDSLNKGETYYARYDRRHDFSLVGAYDISDRWAASTSLLYATGSPFTGQTGQYFIPKPDLTGFESLPAFTSRNALRLSSSFRIDLDIAYKFSLARRIRGDIHLSMYNVLNRTQPDRVQRVWNEQQQTYSYQQKGLFGNITTATVNFNL